MIGAMAPIKRNLCEHKRRRSSCKDCGGGSICEHKRQRSQCKECGGGSICEHQRRRSRCKECRGPAILCSLSASGTKTRPAKTCSL